MSVAFLFSPNTIRSIRLVVGTTRDSSKAVSSSEEQENAFETTNDKQSVQGNMFSNNDPVEKKRKEKTRKDKREEHCR